MSAPPACSCITCRELVAMRVLARYESGLAECVGDDGKRSTVDLVFVEPVAEGDEVLVQAGVALAKQSGGSA